MRADDGAVRQVAVECRLVGAMYGRLDSLVAEALAARGRVLAAPVEEARELYGRDMEVARLARTERGLRAAERSLCFGRIDGGGGEFLHIGRIGLRSEDGRPLLVDWRAEAARPFYEATPVSRLGLRRRRHLRLDGRRVVEVSDEILDGSAPTPQDVVGDGPLVAALGRARTGRMREAVATLQAEQDAIVRSPHRGVTVVDGGPGTGKTIVALHRAAYVLYAFPAAAERGVLVFGPNRRFLDYISEVLPSLGENDVRMATAADLVGVEASATEPEETARFKGRARVGEALADWVRDRQPRATPIGFRMGPDRIVLEAGLVDDAHRRATRDGLAHNPAREAFKEYVVDDLVLLLERRMNEALAALDDEIGVDLDEAVAADLRSLGLDDTVATGGPDVDWDAVRAELLDDPGVDSAVEAVWPRLRTPDALRRFLADHAEQVDQVEQAGQAEHTGPAARRPERVDDEAAAGYTDADLALLDEARALIDGPPERVYGHVVVDEAQELSEVQWRMVMRRCPARSLTVVGDFAQAGSATTVRSWADAVGPFVGDRFAHHALTVNYRTTAEILHAAAPLLARIAPQQRTSRSIRHGERPGEVSASDPAAAVRELAERDVLAHPDELIGVIGPTAVVARLAAALDGTGAVVVAAPEARGLEFDRVYVVDPAAVETARHRGLHDLYVAVTRATRSVVRVHLHPSSRGES